MAKTRVLAKYTYLSVILLSIFLSVPVFAELQVLTWTPESDTMADVDTISVSFNTPMVALGKLPEGNGTGPMIINPPVEGQYRWVNTTTLTCTIKTKLPLATEFKVVIPKGIKSEISGDVLEQPFMWTFNTLRPDLVQSYPRHNQKWVRLDTKIFLVFNQPMDPVKARPFIKLYETCMREGQKEQEVNCYIRKAVAQDTIDNVQHEYNEYYDIEHQNLTKMLVLIPEKKLKQDGVYSVVLNTGLPGEEGGLGSVASRDLRFEAYHRFNFIGPAPYTAVDPQSGIYFVFSNPVRYNDFIRATTIYPDVQLPDHNQYSYFGKNYQDDTCSGNFYFYLNPGTTYYVKTRGELKDIFGQQLGNDIETSFVAKDFTPYINMSMGMGVIESYLSPPRYPVKLLNINQIKLQKVLIDYNDIVPIAMQQLEFTSVSITPPFGYQVDRIWEPKIKKNETTLLPLELNEVLGGSKYGIVLLQAQCPELPGNGKYRHALLQVTSMGITGKFSPDGNLIYVSYLKTANPVIDCIVELRNNNNVTLWTGKTDENGFAKTPGWEELKIIPDQRWETPKLWIIARKGYDVAFSNSEWGTGIYPYQFNLPYNTSTEYPRYTGHLFTERGIYRPGEKMYLKGIVRENRVGKWEIPRIVNYNLFIKDSRSAEVVRTTITLSDFGAFDYTYNIAQAAPTGFYSISLLDSRISTETSSANNNGYDDEGYSYNDHGDRLLRFSSEFRVEEYKPATFEVSVNTDEKEYVIGDTATIKVDSRYLFGAPMSGAELEYTARLDRGYFTPDGWPGYAFGRNYWDNDEQYISSPGVIKSGKDKLDNDGNYSFSCELNTRNPGVYDFIAEGVVTAPDRQRLAGRKSVVVHNGEYYIGIKPVTTFIEKGKDIEVNIITVIPDGKMVTGKQVSGCLKQIEWLSVRKAGVNGRLEWQTEKMETVVSSFNVTSTLTPYQWIYPPGKAGYYVLSVESRDSRGNNIKSTQYFYVTGKDYCGWQRSDDDRIDLICDKIKYKPGDTAKILVKSPYETASAVVTIEREGIISQWRANIVGSADTIEIPITKNHLPNIYVCVMLYKGRVAEKKFSESGNDLGQPSFKIGYTHLPVDPGDKSLDVRVNTDKTEYRPGQRVKVKIKVVNSEGKGVPSEVTLAVVDLGILNLINYQTPNSFPYFYGPRPLSVETSETRLHIVGQCNYGEKGENRGGGGGIFSTIDVRAKFVPTVYWNPVLKTDNSGYAEVTFTLADNLTTFRVMAVVQTKDASFGSGEKRFVVTKPLLLKPSLPRFARLGDKFTAGVLCHNNTSLPGTAVINVDARGLKLLSEPTTQVYLLKGGVKEVRYDFLADKTTSAELVFKAVMDNETDGLKWTVPVTLPRPVEAVATYSSTVDKVVEGIKVPSDIFDDASSINISLASTAMIGLKGGMEYLFEYPYGCCEQKTSKILPLIFGTGIIDIFDLAPLKKLSARDVITSYLDELPQFQSPSGGFRFWKNQGMESPYLTAYVLWAVAEAGKQGFKPDNKMIERAVEYLQAYIRGDSRGWAWPYSINETLTTKAFCVYVLSLHNCHEQSYISHLYQQLPQVPLFGKVYLLKALNLENMDASMINTVLKDIYNNAKISPTETHFENYGDGSSWLWDSATRTTAAILQALLEVKGKYPHSENVVKWLVGERKHGCWRTTQENMYVLYAFNEYVKVYEKEKPDFTAKVLIEGKEVINAMFRGRSLKPVNTKLAVEPYKRDELLPVTFEKTGTGRLYYDFRMIYSPKGVLPAREEGMGLTKTVTPFNSYQVMDSTYALSGRYKVTLKVKTKQERRFVVIDDPVPAGFEVVNLTLATESQEERSQVEAENNNNYRYWGTFDHWECYDDKVMVFANWLQPGEHTYSYLIQAVTAGEFFAPPAKVEEMYTPEVFGRTGQKNVVVR